MFSELSPRPHDTGLVTMRTQPADEFELHARAILGLPIPEITATRPGASAAIVADEPMDAPAYRGVEAALSVPETELRLFGKPDAYAGRRMGVAVATADDVETARDRATSAASSVSLDES
jgi:phosphoribosylglycinamide formyltransferase 2